MRDWKSLFENLFYVSLFNFQKDLIVLYEIIDVMAVDASATSHPLSSEEEDIMTPEDINSMFDRITYSKVNHYTSPHY